MNFDLNQLLSGLPSWVPLVALIGYILWQRSSGKPIVPTPSPNPAPAPMNPALPDLSKRPVLNLLGLIVPYLGRLLVGEKVDLSEPGAAEALNSLGSALTERDDAVAEALVPWFDDWKSKQEKQKEKQQEKQKQQQ